MQIVTVFLCQKTDSLKVTSNKLYSLTHLNKISTHERNMFFSLNILLFQQAKNVRE
jgi:hypothetical protein